MPGQVSTCMHRLYVALQSFEPEIRKSKWKMVSKTIGAQLDNMYHARQQPRELASECEKFLQWLVSLHKSREPAIWAIDWAMWWWHKHCNVYRRDKKRDYLEIFSTLAVTDCPAHQVCRRQFSQLMALPKLYVVKPWSSSRSLHARTVAPEQYRYWLPFIP